ncbi:uncharacterized protein JN550_012676 [Neoarthrinium moseri]|uniref:uncharacterized protein n=1 Tax=Neoarthrinium moseri TaxID=1658444 RepID=UPI001FDB8106|nr:uncharacterized protein JN550_012676 [Neoarthrinium moseri]KAI1858392.1 hypothetical protein JN550_012676 [Neoarthrinium moseri]
MTTLADKFSTEPLSHSQTLAPVLLTAQDVRLAARAQTFTSPTSGLAPGYLQANLIILPSRYASDFRLLCARNPVPCPLIAESASTGCFNAVKSYIPGSPVASNLDIRCDAPRYMVYRDSQLVKAGCLDIINEWSDDHVAFLIGCSFGFESALAAAGLPPRHTVMGKNVPMYRTNVPMCPAGVFSGSTYVVSMRPYKACDIEKVRRITRGYNATHGEPIAWGWDAVAKLGIGSIDQVQWGDAPVTLDGRPLGEMSGSEEELPVFWGCGVTPQEAVMRANLEGIVMGHAPGYMLVIDSQDDDIVKATYT